MSSKLACDSCNNWSSSNTTPISAARYTITKEAIVSLFKLYPNLRKHYAETVPHIKSEQVCPLIMPNPWLFPALTSRSLPLAADFLGGGDQIWALQPQRFVDKQERC